MTLKLFDFHYLQYASLLIDKRLVSTFTSEMLLWPSYSQMYVSINPQRLLNKLSVTHFLIWLVWQSKKYTLTFSVSMCKLHIKR